MATEFTQDEVLKFLCGQNGKVKNSELLEHFKWFLREDENRAQNRELFKRFVNSVAVVKREENVSYVLLRKKYMGLIRYVGDTPARKTQGEKTTKPNTSEALPRDDSSIIPEKGPTNNRTDFQVKGKKPSVVDFDDTPQENPEKMVLLAAGIVDSNPEAVCVETYTNILPSQAPEHLPPLTVRSTDKHSRTLKPTELHLQSIEAGESCQQVQTSTVATEAVFPSSQSPAVIGDVKENTGIAEQGLSKDPDKKSKSSLDCEYDEIKIIVPENVGLNNTQRRLSDQSLQGSSESVSTSQPLHNLLASNPRISSSTPCLLNCSESANSLPDYLLEAHSNGSLSRLNDRFHYGESSEEEEQLSSQSVRHGILVNTAQSRNLPGFSEHYQVRLSSSHGDLLQPPYDDHAWPEKLSKEAWSSDESFNSRDSYAEQGGKVRAMLRRAQEARLLSKLRSSEGKLGPLHHSMGNLDDEGSAASQASSGSSTPVRMRSGTRRTRSQLRSRLCRSLGADLDQPFFEDGVSARLNRLNLLSSSLSINYSTPPRMRSYGDISSHGSGSSRNQSIGDGSGFHRNSMVPLEPKEHDWMVKAAAGTWPDIYALFREEPGLLNRRDFISGYTVLHWIAKHGDHRVLNTLSYGVSKMGLVLDVDVKTTCGYTPLHLAAIHGHKKLIRLLVHKFKANVALRDTSGKKAWQYLGKGGPRDLLQLLGAPLRITRSHDSKNSRSTGKQMIRPGTMSPKVKRHSSIAAFLKHKSLLRVAGHHEAFV